jgi:hypothetical protein
VGRARALLLSLGTVATLVVVATALLVLACAALAAHGFPGLEEPGSRRAFVRGDEAPAPAQRAPVVLGAPARRSAPPGG